MTGVMLAVKDPYTPSKIKDEHVNMLKDMETCREGVVTEYYFEDIDATLKELKAMISDPGKSDEQMAFINSMLEDLEAAVINGYTELIYHC